SLPLVVSTIVEAWQLAKGAVSNKNSDETSPGSFATAVVAKLPTHTKTSCDKDCVIFNSPVRELKPIEVRLAESSAPAQSTITRQRQKCQISASTRHANREAPRNPNRRSRRRQCSPNS